MSTIEQLYFVKAADSLAIQNWRDKARIQAQSALLLATEPPYVVYAARNTKGTLLGLVGCYTGVKSVVLAHLATRDGGQGVGSELVAKVMEYAGDLAVKTIPEPGAEGFYVKLGWRKVGSEYWSK